MYRKKFAPVLILFAFVLLALLPYFQKGLILGDDYLYHLARIESIADNLRTGDFPVKVHNIMNMGYGYGSGFFYSDFFLYFPACLVLFGMSLWNAYKCFVALLLLVCACIVYYCTFHMTHHTGASLLSACLYLFSEPFLTDLYGRFAVGECLAFVFVPLILCGIQNLFQEDFDMPWILGAGFLGLIFSHMITLAESILFLGVVLLLHARVLYRKPELIRKLLWTAAIDLLLSVGFWAPMLEQIASGNFRFMKSWTSVAQNVLTLQDIGIGGSHSVGAAMIAAAILLVYGAGALIKLRKNEKENRRTTLQTGIWFMITGYLLILLTICQPFWKLFGKLLNFMQFPWRLDVYAMALLSIGSGVLFADLFREWKKNRAYIFYLLCAAFCCLIILPGVQYGDARRDKLAGNELLDVTAYSVSNGGGEEWEPDRLSSNQLDKNKNNLVLREDGKSFAAGKTGSMLIFRDEIKSKKVKSEKTESYLLPFVYYKGYQAFYIEDNGDRHRLTLTKDIGSDLIRIMGYPYGESDKEKRKAGYYSVNYAGTSLQHLSYLLETVSWITCFLIWLSLKDMRKREKIDRNKNVEEQCL